MKSKANISTRNGFLTDRRGGSRQKKTIFIDLSCGGYYFPFFIIFIYDIMALQIKQLLTDFIAANPDIETRLTSAALSQSDYTSAYSLVSSYTNAHSGLRALITLADGTVLMDTSKGSNNTFNNFDNKTINENHNSRSAMLQALLGKSGEGFEEKFSTSTNQTERYQAIKTGASPQRPNFLIRFSKKI